MTALSKTGFTLPSQPFAQTLGIHSAKGQTPTESRVALYLNEHKPTLAGLKTLRQSLGRHLHPALKKKGEAQGDLKGLVLTGQNAHTVQDAFATNDGSSKYLRGALAKAPQNSTPNSNKPHSQTVKSIFDFLIKNQLPGSTVIGAAHQQITPAGFRAQSFLANDPTYVEDSFVHVEFSQAPLSPHEQNLNHRALIEISAILSLTQMAQDLDIPLSDDLVETDGLEPITYPEELHVLDNANLIAWHNMAPILQQHSLELCVGESFTFGKLARIFSETIEFSAQLYLNYGWYDPRFKLAMGVDKSNITDDNIATPNTVIQGATGILNSQPHPESLIALGTSGWANNCWLGDKVDFFSVALATKAHAPKDHIHTQAFPYRVGQTAKLPISPQRRELTRLLGVTASLYLLSEYIINHIQDSPDTRAVSRMLLGSLEHFKELSSD